MHLGTKRFCAGVFCIAALALLVSGLTNAEPRWPQYGFNARHTMYEHFELSNNRENDNEFLLRRNYMPGNGTQVVHYSTTVGYEGAVYIGQRRCSNTNALSPADIMR